MSDNARFAQDLIAVGRHMTSHPDLPQVFGVGPAQGGGYTLDIQLRDGGIEGLALWSRTLTDVTSHARRMLSGHVHAYVNGVMAGIRVRVWTDIPGDGFPEERGTHEWDVTVQVQEA